MKSVTRVIKKIITNPRSIVCYMNTLGLLNYLPEVTCIKLLWWAKTGRRLNLSNPSGFNEKLQWLKAFDHCPEYSDYVDKVRVRDYVKKTVGEKYLVPLLGLWDNPEQICFDSLPDQFVLKCNHNSGAGMCICRDKSRINVRNVRDELRKGLNKKNYYESREWPYKNVVPKILCEPLIIDHDPKNTTGTLIDYKFYCFNGEPKFLYVGTDDISSGAKGELKLSFFDLDWKTPPFYRADHRPISIIVEKPERFDEMISVAKELSKGIPFVRIDLYWVNKQVYFSEMTFFPGGGYGFFSPKEWEEELGSWISLPISQNQIT